MHNINDNAVQGRLSENYLLQKFIARNINFWTRNIRNYGSIKFLLKFSYPQNQ